MMEMKNLIITWRKYFDLTQEKLAELAGFTRQAVFLWEKGKRIPDTGTLSKIASALGIDYQDFLAGPEVYKQKKEESRQSSVRELHLFPQPIKISGVYSAICESLDRSTLCGASFKHLSQGPENFIHIILDTNGQPVQSSGVAEISLKERPKPGDRVLVYHQGRAQIVIWKAELSPYDFDTVYGPIINTTQ
jgi:transcriptional regulator with XRE-family HTH domain